jgi:AcrR family transcriptional regulator
MQTDRDNGAGNGHLPLAASDRERVTEIQRARMIEAAVCVAGEVGARNITVADIVASAGVSRRTFYEIFDDCEDCFLVAFDHAASRAGERAAAGWRSHRRWRARTRSALGALLRFLDEEPHLARLLVVEALGGGAGALARRQQMLARLIAAVDEARSESHTARNAPPLTAEGVVGAVASVVHARLLENQRQPLGELLNPLMSMIVLPYLGGAAARREMTEPLPDRRPAASRAPESPLKTLGMRVTYRTARTLAAVACHPGASNKQIGDASGIGDQGQVSKLLSRLEKLGLVENAGVGAASRGAPNAWRLTRRGEEVHLALTAEPCA